MAVEEKSVNKLLYKIQLLLLKVIPMVMAFIVFINTILSYYDIDLEIFSYLGSCSLLMVTYLYVASYVFKFCEYHRMFLHYIVVTTAINIYDLYVGVPLTNRSMVSLYTAIAVIFLFIILYLHVKNNKKSSN